MIDIDALGRDRDQLWAEAVARFRSGAIWWLDTPELIAEATTEQEKRYQADAWDDLIEHWLTHETRKVAGEYPGYGAPTVESVPRAAPLTSVSVGEVLEQAIGIAPAFWTQKDQNRISAYLKRNGWVRRMCREPGGRRAKRAWRYEKAHGRQEEGA
jgi:predicted P-loop ATPase